MCGEEKPECANCVRFGVQCSFASGVAIRKGPPSSTSVLSEQSLSEIRGRGRPRNNWTATVEHDEVSEASGISWASATPSPSTAEGHIDKTRPNVQEAELLLHFVQVTAYTLAGSDKSDDPMVPFWTYNLPRIGLSHHFTLHLAYAVAGYHLAYLNKTEDRHQGLRRLAELHASAGIAQLTATLARLDRTNCGAAYISATLVCYCTFAAGPAGPGDLLVCNVDQDRDHNWLPSIHGLRLLRESFDADVLFSGLMDPFHPKSHAQDKDATPARDNRARCSREGFLRVDWEEPLSDLRGFIVMYDDGGDDDDGICLRSLDSLIAIYRATYGDKDGSYDGPQEYQHAFGWLYREFHAVDRPEPKHIRPCMTSTDQPAQRDSDREANADAATPGSVHSELGDGGLVLTGRDGRATNVQRKGGEGGDKSREMHDVKGVLRPLWEFM
ncbi:hypothetical protein DL764_003841 [Monosporascus ibericus]|uniref:Zn(2)-C6 fungal-type domain-containing protein n=1 Tax=Monosporascus ibericus TaxID=155417 RepID=A0A4Q4TF18_9PEZI|nr:hypothetical protein DL764_003841 [Monosporascus ibericus]